MGLTWRDLGGGILDGARFVSSPNCDERSPGEQVSLVVVHSISLPPGEFSGSWVEALFTNTLDPNVHPYFREIDGLKVSSHFFIRRDGALIQFVPCDFRAWHAGASIWSGRERCNDFSIGIELEGCDELGFELAQYDRLNQLVMALRQRYPITSIVAHADIAPGRKTDPGPFFDWTRLREAPLS